MLDVSTIFLFFVFGDLVSGTWGSIPGPGEGLLRGFWTPDKKYKIAIVIRAQRAPTFARMIFVIVLSTLSATGIRVCSWLTDRP